MYLVPEGELFQTCMAWQLYGGSYAGTTMTAWASRVDHRWQIWLMSWSMLS